MNILSRIAWRNIGRNLRRSIITAIAMGMGTAMCIGIISFADGWIALLFNTVVSRQIGHVQIHSIDYPRHRLIHQTIGNVAELESTLLAIPEAAGVSFRAHAHILLAVGEEAAGVQLIGIDPDREHDVTGLADRLTKGSYLDGSPGQILLGVDLANTLGASLGDDVVAVTQAADGSMGNALFRVRGIHRTGSAQIDRAGAFVSLGSAQNLLAIGEGAHEVALVARNREEIPLLLTAVGQAVASPNLSVRSWAEIDPATARMMDMMDAVVLIVLFLVFSLASLGVLNTMLMSVLERIPELGVLQALGLRPAKLLRLVLWETFFLSSLAAVMGGGIGVLLALFLEKRGLDLSSIVGDIKHAGMVYEPVIYGELRLDRVAMVIAFMFLISLLASLWPALRAARLDPVDAMRHA